MGGLRQKKTSKDISKVPFFSDLLLIGGIFKGETESVKSSELIIFISTRIVGSPQLSAVEAQTLDATEFVMPKLSTTRLKKKNQQTAQPSDVNDISDILKRLYKQKQ